MFDFEPNFKQKRTKIDVQTKTFFIKFIPNFQILIFNFSAIRCKLGFGGSAGVHTFQKSDLTLFGCARQLPNTFFWKLLQESKKILKFGRMSIKILKFRDNFDEFGDFSPKK